MLRVVVVGARPAGAAGPDVTDRLARALRDAGHEVVLAGTATAQQSATAALQEDADVVVVVRDGPEVAAVRDLLDRAGADDVAVHALGPGDDAVRGLVAGLVDQR